MPISDHIPAGPGETDTPLLNESQAAAVFHEGGPLLVVAGAGSGKTRVLTYRIAHLIRSHQAGPYEILAITFTNKAAGEMKNRVVELVGPVAQTMWVSTFHAACARILRREAEVLGYRSGFSIYDSDDQVRLVKHCLEDLGYDAKRFPPRAIHARISDAKNRLIDVDEFASGGGGGTPAWAGRQGAWGTGSYLEVAGEVYRLYQRKLYELNAMDFDDLIMRTVEVLQLEPRRLAHYRAGFRQVLVDEYQDTNHAQYILVKLLAEEHQQITVVGDDDQSVYSWRGADIRNILEFERDFPGATVVTLEQNYRSTTTILKAANAVVDHNRGRKSKRLWSDLGEGEPVVLLEAENEHEEARLVAGEIQSLIRDGRDPSGIAVFYRVNAQSRVLEDILVRYGIAYQVVGGTKFYERAEIKDVLAYLRVLCNPVDDLSFQRIVNTPKRGLGEVAQGRLQLLAAEHGLSLRAALALVEEQGEFSPGARKALTCLHQVFLRWEERHRARDDLRAGVVDQIRAVMEESGLVPALQAEHTLENEGRLENLQEFLVVAQEFDAVNPGGDLTDFLEGISLYADADVLQEQASLVTLMTLHNAKGLEFDYVFIVGMEEGVFPHSRALDEQNLEEERRLCYVGITRARERVHLSYARQRSLYGAGNYNVPSRFLDEIPEALVERRGRRGSGSLGAPRRAATSFRRSGASSALGSGVQGTGLIRRSGAADEGQAPGKTTFVVGDTVVHAKFGAGVVLGVDAGGVVRVFFQDLGEQKRLLIDYAPLKRM
ncbi:MAG: UvrD-helicase domain-containing protein [Thermoleophilia bacterium]|nr:UvrD-helicase domain-containing protein [Thermoleophilia bacterium]